MQIQSYAVPKRIELKKQDYRIVPNLRRGASFTLKCAIDFLPPNLCPPFYHIIFRNLLKPSLQHK